MFRYTVVHVCDCVQEKPSLPCARWALKNWPRLTVAHGFTKRTRCPTLRRCRKEYPRALLGYGAGGESIQIGSDH